MGRRKTINFAERVGLATRRRPDYAEALCELWPPSVVVPSVAGGEGIRLSFAGGWRFVGMRQPPLFLFPLTLQRKSSPIIWRRPPRLFPHIDLRAAQRRRRTQAVA